MKSNLVFAAGLLAVTASASVAQSADFTGRWATLGRTLDNGEQEKMLITLTQTGTNVAGTLENFGGPMELKGTVKDGKLTVFASWNPTMPFATCERKAADLSCEMQGPPDMPKMPPMVAHPATAADTLPKATYIEPPAVHALADNGLAKHPPMGWNSWNLFADRVDDATVRTMADAMVSSGMKDAGYIYINIDDTWQGLRDKNGVLQPNHKFPDMKALADYVHSKGLKLGIYSGPGPRTCASYPGSLGYEQIDAKTWADWGIDYLKYDWCSASSIYNKEHLQPVYQKMGEALQATGRPIVYSLCEYGWGDVAKWGDQVSGNLWRTTGDIRDEWGSMIGNIEEQAHNAPYARPGHWNDPDMLEIGNGHMTGDEYRTHMSLWALTASPLLAGNDLRKMTEETRSILMNREVIAVDQDDLGKQAVPVKKGELELWVKPLADGSVAVGLVNLGKAATEGSVTLADLGLKTGVTSARDLWTHREVTFAGANYTAKIAGHATLLLRVSGR